MSGRIVSGIMLTLLIVSMLSLAFNIEPVKASGTIYIRADGSIDPPTAAIATVDNVTYVLTGNTNDSVVVERSNIIVDGNGYTLQGNGSGSGFYLSSIDNVTIKHTTITGFYYGICLNYSNNNIITENNVDHHHEGITLYYSSNNSINGNNVAKNRWGVYLFGFGPKGWSSNNSIVGNTFTNDGLLVDLGSYQNRVEDNVVNARPLVYLEGVSDYTVDGAGQVILIFCDNIRVKNLNLSNTTVGLELMGTRNSKIENNNIANSEYGIAVASSSNNNIVGNNIITNSYGIWLWGWSSNNSIYHNNFINNGNQVHLWPIEMPNNSWDNGYPSGGNYWSDYEERYPNAEEIDDSGIWNTTYVVDANHYDHYPFMNPWRPLLGDVNGDDTIDILDLVEAAGAFGAVPGSWAWKSWADVYPDGRINIFDLVMIALRFGQHR